MKDKTCLPDLEGPHCLFPYTDANEGDRRKTECQRQSSSILLGCVLKSRWSIVLAEILMRRQL